MRYCYILSMGALLICGLSASTVEAQSLYAGLLGGYASTTSQHDNVEPYGAALGASAGVTLPVFPLYLGARLAWFFGDGGTVAAVSLNRHYLLYGVDLGYDAVLGPVVIRPSLGVGRATLESSVKSLGLTLSSSDSSLYLAPGIGLIVKAAMLYVGAELRYNAITEKNQFNSLSILASVGLTL